MAGTQGRVDVSLLPGNTDRPTESVSATGYEKKRKQKKNAFMSASPSRRCSGGKKSKCLSKLFFGTGEGETLYKCPSPAVAPPLAFVRGRHCSLLADAEVQ